MQAGASAVYLNVAAEARSESSSTLQQQVVSLVFVLLILDNSFIRKMAVLKVALIFAICGVVIQAQRPSYAGLRPIGYPEIETNNLSNRFGENEDLPVEAKGDRNLINRLNALPVDKQPFWFINWRQYEAQRKNPQTYPVRPNVFANSK